MYLLTGFNLVSHVEIVRRSELSVDSTDIRKCNRLTRLFTRILQIARLALMKWESESSNPRVTSQRAIMLAWM
jgi:hypothetical protein